MKLRIYIYIYNKETINGKGSKHDFAIRCRIMCCVGRARYKKKRA